jgi:hypothetical protein
MSEKVQEELLKLCSTIQQIDDALGRYADYEGSEEGPTFYLYGRGYKEFGEHCDRAIQDHKIAVQRWKALKRFNEQRKGNHDR